MTTPVPSDRGRWRFTLHQRVYTPTPWQQTIVAVLTDVRSRRLEQGWNAAAQLSFSIDGRSSQAALIQELATEVIAWRWDEQIGADRPMFRGVIDHGEDTLSEQAYTINFVAHDLLGIIGRRYLTGTVTYTQTDQDLIVANLLSLAVNAHAGDGTSFLPGSWLAVSASITNPDGTIRGQYSGQLRDRTYTGSTAIGQSVDDLAKVIGGFDYDIRPLFSDTVDALRVFYPTQGVTRSDIVLMYGATVSALTRTVASTDYANYQRVLGNNGNSDPSVPQLAAEAWDNNATPGVVGSVGLWQATDSAADVTDQATLAQKAHGDLNLSGLLVPSYSLTMRPGAYSYGNPNLGDTVPLIVLAGRLNVNTTIRVLGITYAISDDGAEDVTLTVGRPLSTLADLFTRADRDVDALTRR